MTVEPKQLLRQMFDAAVARAMPDRCVPPFLPKFPAGELARVIVQNARFPQPEIVMALDAQAIAFFNALAPGAIDFVLGQSLPFFEGLRRGWEKSQPGSSGRRPRAASD